MIKRTPRKDKIAITLPRDDTPKEELKKNLIPRAPKDLERARERVLTAKEQEKEAFKDIIRQLITDPLYLINLQRRLREGKLAPAVESYFWQFMAGKPTELIEVRKATAVKIVHEFLGEQEIVIDQGEENQDSKDAMEQPTDEVPEVQDAILRLRGGDSVGEEHGSGVEDN